MPTVAYAWSAYRIPISRSPFGHGNDRYLTPLGLLNSADGVAEYHVDDYGAVGDATSGGTVKTADSAAFQAAIDAASAAGGGTVYFNKQHLIDAGITVATGVALVGPIRSPDFPQPSTTTSYDANDGVLYVNSAHTITLQRRAALSNCYILRKGLQTPLADEAAAVAAIAAFAGTAVTVNNHGVSMDHVILGFNKAIYSFAAGAPSRGQFFLPQDGLHQRYSTLWNARY